MNQKESELLRLCDEIDALLVKDPGTLTERECSRIYTTLRSAAGTISAAARQSVRGKELLREVSDGGWIISRDLQARIAKEIEND